jgi:S1-C subfamily serine protease
VVQISVKKKGGSLFGGRGGRNRQPFPFNPKMTPKDLEDLLKRFGLTPNADDLKELRKRLNPDGDAPRRKGERPRVEKEQLDFGLQGTGSGFVWDSKGHIVTNNHVVEGATELAVAMPDGTLRTTKVLGVDPDSDLALLAVDPKGLHPIELGDIKNLAVGDVVLAVGNPLGVGQTVTQGIVSAIGRKGIGINPIENFIQTDAAINPGNSGGALIDTAGRLVGINSAILSRGGGSEGIGFAIPVNLVQRVIPNLEKSGRVARGWLGISTQAAPSGQPGAIVLAVSRGGPADKVGIEAGDVIVKLGDAQIDDPDDLVGSVLQLDPGTRVPLDIVRNGKRQTVEVELGRRPPLRRSASAGG